MYTVYCLYIYKMYTFIQLINFIFTELCKNTTSCGETSNTKCHSNDEYHLLCK